MVGQSHQVPGGEALRVSPRLAQGGAGGGVDHESRSRCLREPDRERPTPVRLRSVPQRGIVLDQPGADLTEVACAEGAAVPGGWHPGDLAEREDHGRVHPGGEVAGAGGEEEQHIRRPDLGLPERVHGLCHRAVERIPVAAAVVG